MLDKAKVRLEGLRCACRKSASVSPRARAACGAERRTLTFAASKCSNVDIQQASAEDLSAFPSNTYDAATGCYVLMFVGWLAVCWCLLVVFIRQGLRGATGPQICVAQLLAVLRLVLDNNESKLNSTNLI